MKKIIALLLLTIMLCTTASAGSLSGVIRDRDNNLYLVRHSRITYGMQYYRGHIYYAYRTRHGRLAQDCYKILHGKWYYFCHNGRAQERDSTYIDIRSADKSVRFVYIPGTNRKMRYSTKEKRYQMKEGHRWNSVGMEVIPSGMVDWVR